MKYRPATASRDPIVGTEGHITIERMAYGPHGVGRLHGKTLFVRGVAPGERVRIIVREDHGGFAYADVLEVQKPSALRREPPCPYLPRCGGCPWQHLTDDTQRTSKLEILDDVLRRIAGLSGIKPRAMLESRDSLHYRSRLKLRVEDGQPGFYAGASHDLIPIDACLLATTKINAAMDAVRQFLRGAASRIRRIEISERGDLPGVVFHCECEGTPAETDGDWIEGFLTRTQQVAGISLQGGGRRTAWGDDRLHYSPEEGLWLATRAGAFTQVNPEMNRQLVGAVIDLSEVTDSDRVLDLYAGSGNLSIPLARRASSVVAVESDFVAAQDARANATTAGLTNLSVRNVAADRAVREADSDTIFDLVVLDPPRSGAADVIDPLLQLAAKRLVYVSCDPTTLARDLARLKSRYRIDTIQPLDLFPQTYHLETIVRLTRT